MAKLTKHSSTQLPFWGELLPSHPASSWEGKTRNEILNDIISAIEGVGIQIADNYCSFLEPGDKGIVEEAVVRKQFFDPIEDRFNVVLPICRDMFLGLVNDKGQNITEYIQEKYPKAEFMAISELESQEDDTKHEMWIVPTPPETKNPVIDEIGICRNPTAIYRVVGI